MGLNFTFIIKKLLYLLNKLLSIIIIIIIITEIKLMWNM